MSDGWIGYHSERIGQLRAYARVAADDLRSMASDDPAAVAAMGVVEVTRLHLERDWLPLLDRISASTAMISPFGRSPFASITDDLFGWLPGDGGAKKAWGSNLRPAVARSAPGANSNEQALARARAAAASGVTGTFFGTTKSYEVVSTPTSTTLPNAQNCTHPNCEQYDIVVRDRWYFEHDIGTGPAILGSLPPVRWMGLAAKLFGRERGSDALTARAKELESFAERARDGAGAIRKGRNVAVGRLTRADGEEIDSSP